jgi:hypothetical protein
LKSYGLLIVAEQVSFAGALQLQVCAGQGSHLTLSFSLDLQIGLKIFFTHVGMAKAGFLGACYKSALPSLLKVELLTEAVLRLTGSA